MKWTRSFSSIAPFAAPLLVFWLCAHANAQQPAEPYLPQIATASDEGIRAIKRIRLTEGLELDLVAAEPLLANPVAFAIDDQGRFYVAETHRLHDGVTDIRDHMDWLDDDLACRTVEDRLRMMTKFLGDKLAAYARHHDRVRLIEDSNGDGRADRATVFADGFGSAVDGIGSGLLARGGKVWYACIPDLWLLEDTNADGRADQRRSLQHGYGVHVGFLGHDLHGLCMGPDGKLYFTIGDRGLNVATLEGRIVHPDAGAVLRCNPDGSQLEVFATGLRNPQELAFDQHGNLFTGDNNSDGGDQARWVWVVEGGDSGWRIGYQFIESPFSRGPWNAEKMWQPQNQGQPAFLVPPIANLADGPSGLCYYPGTGLTDRYREHFFLCDFRGSSGNSGIRSFALAPKGAAFELVDQHEFVWSVLATDVDFGVDDGVYFIDWVEGWNKTGKGRIYKVFHPAMKQSPQADELKQMFRQSLAERSSIELGDLLAHPDMRVRQRAQFALAARGCSAAHVLSAVACREEELLARLHAIWGLGQIAAASPEVLTPLVALLADDEAEVRAQAARVAGDHRLEEAFAPLVGLLEDASPRVRFFAAMGLAKFARLEAIEPLVQVLRSESDRDPYLRHAAVLALAASARLAGTDRLLEWAHDASGAVRMGVLLALRRLEDPAIARFLTDNDPDIVTEAARAINDVPIDDAMPELAKLITCNDLPEPALRRALNANLRLGQPEHAQALARFAARAGAIEPLRIEALECLEQWAQPSSRDRITGLWRPLAARGIQGARAALRQELHGVFAAGEAVRDTGARVAAVLGLDEVRPELQALAADPAQPVGSRVTALQALAQLGDARLHEAVQLALTDDEPKMRAAAQQLLARLEPSRALGVLRGVLETGALAERQAAFATLARMRAEQADSILSHWLDKLLDGEVPPELQLDLVVAVAKRDMPPLTDKMERFERSLPRSTPLEKFSESLVGGDAQSGRRIFFQRADVSCLKCHKIDGQGGEVGPDLSKLAADHNKTREYLLESIVDPDRQIAKGFDTVVVTTVEGLTHTGVLKAEDEETLTLITAEGHLITVAKDKVDERARGQSAMPEKLAEMLSKSELRDLIEFLTTLR